MTKMQSIARNVKQQEFNTFLFIGFLVICIVPNGEKVMDL